MYDTFPFVKVTPGDLLTHNLSYGYATPSGGWMVCDVGDVGVVVSVDRSTSSCLASTERT
jgi:hypothetical protein